MFLCGNKSVDKEKIMVYYIVVPLKEQKGGAYGRKN
jgi:hypothetical protein